MYTTYWNLKEKPFENTPDPKFLYYSSQHEEAMGRLIYTVRERKGAALVTGEYGCGKTLLSRVLKNELQQKEKYQNAFILDPRLTGKEFLREIIYQLSAGNMPKTKIDIFHALDRILRDNHKNGKHTVLVIDEAQSIKNRDILEELRLLLNFQLDDAFLMTIILIGSSEIKMMLSEMPHFVQRMAVRYHINGLNEREVKEYIKHRLGVAGASRQMFQEDTYYEIYLSTYGVPRRINTLCDLSLLVGMSNKASIIDKNTIIDIRDDIDLPKMEPGDDFQASPALKHFETVS